MSRAKEYKVCNAFASIESCADYIMNQLYDGPSKDPWVVAKQESEDDRFMPIFIPIRLSKAMEEFEKYYEISWPNGNRILEAN